LPTYREARRWRRARRKVPIFLLASNHSLKAVDGSSNLIRGFQVFLGVKDSLANQSGIIGLHILEKLSSLHFRQAIELNLSAESR
jgi:hypothetical protein